MAETIDRIIAIDGVDTSELYGANDTYLQQIKELHPKLRIIARG